VVESGSYYQGQGNWIYIKLLAWGGPAEGGLFVSLSHCVCYVSN